MLFQKLIREQLALVLEENLPREWLIGNDQSATKSGFFDTKMIDHSRGNSLYGSGQNSKHLNLRFEFSKSERRRSFLRVPVKKNCVRYNFPVRVEMAWWRQLRHDANTVQNVWISRIGPQRAIAAIRKGSTVPGRSLSTLPGWRAMCSKYRQKDTYPWAPPQRKSSGPAPGTLCEQIAIRFRTSGEGFVNLGWRLLMHTWTQAVGTCPV